jgi:hypothetical protein
VVGAVLGHALECSGPLPARRGCTMSRCYRRTDMSTA